MSELFAALKTIRAEQEATVHEYARVAARTRDAVPTTQSKPLRRWPSGMVSGVLGFVAGIAATLFATTPSRTLPVQGNTTATVSVATVDKAPPPSIASHAAAAEERAIVMAAMVAEPSQPAVNDAPVAHEPAMTSEPEAKLVNDPLPALPPAADPFWVQVGAFKFRENAARLRVRLEDGRRSVVVRPGRPDALPWVLAVGPYADERAAHEAELALAGEGFPGFVVRGDR